MLILSNLFKLSNISVTAPTCDSRVPQPLGSNAWWSGVIIIEIKCTINIMHLNHPQNILPLPCSVEKIVFHETSPWNQKGWGLLSRPQFLLPQLWLQWKVGRVIAGKLQFFLALLSPAPSQGCQEGVREMHSLPKWVFRYRESSENAWRVCFCKTALKKN